MKLSNGDWVQLSAYLDGELNHRDMDRLKRRIEADPDFQAALDELRVTKQILKQTPKIRVPRNFTLTPDQVGQKSRRPVYQRYRLAAAVMSFFLVGIFILDFGSIFLRGGLSQAMAPMAEEIMMEKAVEESLDIPAEEPALLAADAEGENDRSAANEAAASETEDLIADFAEMPEGEPVESTVDELAAPAAEFEDGIAQDTAPPEATAAEGMADEESARAEAVEVQAPGEDEASADTKAGESKAAGGDTDNAEPEAEQTEHGDQANLASPTGIAPTSPNPTESATYIDDEPITWDEPRRGIPPLRILEIIFTVGVLGFGITACVLRRKDLK
jgi:hypothetical protein